MSTRLYANLNPFKFVAGSAPLAPSAPLLLTTCAFSVNLNPAIVVLLNSFARVILPVRTASSALVSFPNTLLLGPNNAISLTEIVKLSS